MRHVLPILALPILFLVACGAGTSHPAATGTPDTGPSIAELSQEAAASATAAALARAQAAQAGTPTPAATSRRAAGAAAASNAALADRLLSTADLPQGFRLLAGPTPVSFTFNVGQQTGSVEGWVAGYTGATAGGGHELLLLELIRYAGASPGPIDLDAAYATFLPSLNSSLTQAGLVARPAQTSLGVGDDARSFTVNGTNSQYSGGAGVLFRRGDVLAVVIVAAGPAPATNDDLNALAQQQDAKLRTVTE